MSREFAHELDIEAIESLARALFLMEQKIRAAQREPGRVSVFDHSVGRYFGFKFEIFSNEHPPPHFRVSKSGISANYSITDCKRLHGHEKFDRFDKIIQNWWRENREILVETWNNVRPSDCTVGPIKE
ncbi:MAG: hypothetical protein Hens3KO_05290 [Henriciella sp.]